MNHPDMAAGEGKERIYSPNVAIGLGQVSVGQTTPRGAEQRGNLNVPNSGPLKASEALDQLFSTIEIGEETINRLTAVLCNHCQQNDAYRFAAGEPQKQAAPDPLYASVTAEHIASCATRMQYLNRRIEALLSCLDVVR